MLISTQAAVQIAYVNYFTNTTHYQFVGQLFKRFLPTSPAVELWQLYLSYVRYVGCVIGLQQVANCTIRRLNANPRSRDNVRKAYDYALNHIGQDKDSGTFWMEYVQFLRAEEVCDSISSHLLFCRFFPHIVFLLLPEFIYFLYFGFATLCVMREIA
jgi:hypothetical protein